MRKNDLKKLMFCSIIISSFLSGCLFHDDVAWSVPEGWWMTEDFDNWLRITEHEKPGCGNIIMWTDFFNGECPPNSPENSVGVLYCEFVFSETGGILAAICIDRGEDETVEDFEWTLNVKNWKNDNFLTLSDGEITLTFRYTPPPEEG